MSSQEIIGTILAVGFLIIALCFAFITFYLIKALKSLSTLAESLQNTSENIRGKIQNRFMLAIPALLITLIGRILKKRG